MGFAWRVVGPEVDLSFWRGVVQAAKWGGTYMGSSRTTGSLATHSASTDADPAEAINGTYIDKKCPFTGDVSIRGRILTGVVHSTKMTNTIIIRREYLHFIPKYRRYEKRHKNLAAHCSPAFRVEQGDTVTVGECQSRAT
jgi:ribosomal protein S17